MVASSVTKNAVFVIASDTQLEVAEELATAWRRRWPQGRLTVVSTRRAYFPEEYPDARLETRFDHVVPVRPAPGGLRRRLGKLLRKLPGSAGVLPAPTPSRFGGFAGALPAKIDVVFVLNDRMSPETELIRYFQSRKVPVALVQESIRRDDSTVSSPGCVWNGQGGADVIYAWGETSIDYYQRAGVPRERIVATGNPRIDRYVEAAARLPSQAELRARMGLNAGQPVVLIAGNPVYRMGLLQPLSKAAYIEATGKALEWAREAGCQAVLKPHQLERPDFKDWGVSAWLKKFPHAVDGTDFSLVDAVQASDAVLVFNSTVALEAALLGRPSGLLAMGEYGHGTDFLETGLSRRVDSVNDLKLLLKASRPESAFGSTTKYLIRVAGSSAAILDDVASRRL